MNKWQTRLKMYAHGVRGPRAPSPKYDVITTTCQEQTVGLKLFTASPITIAISGATWVKQPSFAQSMGYSARDARKAGDSGIAYTGSTETLTIATGIFPVRQAAVAAVMLAAGALPLRNFPPFHSARFFSLRPA